METVPETVNSVPLTPPPVLRGWCVHVGPDKVVSSAGSAQVRRLYGREYSNLSSFTDSKMNLLSCLVGISSVCSRSRRIILQHQLKPVPSSENTLCSRESHSPSDCNIGLDYHGLSLWLTGCVASKGRDCIFTIFVVDLQRVLNVLSPTINTTEGAMMAVAAAAASCS
jgi:hypothetical protein